MCVMCGTRYVGRECVLGKCTRQYREAGVWEVEIQL